ncbi:MAG: phospholipase D family protein [Thermoguttaceae bacterium]
MPRRFLTCLLLALTIPALARAQPPIEVYFSPKGGCTDAVVRELNAAKATVLMQAYSFTSARIAKALLDARKRGVQVEVILDKSQKTEKYSEADFLANSGIPTRIDAQHAIAHNKVIVIDRATVISGSFNFTTAAESHNAENLLVIRSPKIAAKYADNWKAHAGHSEPYGARTEGYSQTARRQDPEAKRPTAAVAALHGFVASKKSAVFHRTGCKSAGKIAETNLVLYATREEAIQAGKKPCAECDP